MPPVFLLTVDSATCNVTPMPKRPALKRRIAFYDLNEYERAQLREFADLDKETISRWVANAVRREINLRLRARLNERSSDAKP